MKQVKYILVNETVCKNTDCDVTYRNMPHLGYCAECFAVPGFKVQGSKERAKFLNELCRLRRQWPEAPILGVSEVDFSSNHAPIRVNQEMNELRRKLSEL